MVESTTDPANPPPAPETTTVPAAVKRLRIGRNQAYKAVANGQLPAIKIGRRLLVPTAALDRMLNGESAA
jgi:excisionase family DNA binding protein